MYGSKANSLLAGSVMVCWFSVPSLLLLVSSMYLIVRN